MRAYSNIGGMAYFPVGEIVSVEPVNEKVYRVSGEEHKRIRVSVWKLRECTRPAGDEES